MMANQRGGPNQSDSGAWSRVKKSVWAGKPAAMLELRTSALRHLTAFRGSEIRKCVADSPRRVRLRVEAKGVYFGENLAATV